MSSGVFHFLKEANCLFVFCTEADMRREMERKEQERRNSQKVDFISGGTQPGAVTMQKPNLPIPGFSLFHIVTLFFVLHHS